MTSVEIPCVNGARLWESLMETAHFGGLPGGGISRLALSDSDKAVRDWFKRACEELGCEVFVDQVGNMFAVWNPTRSQLRPIAVGSHLDTQPTGGKFDGVLGVLAGLEVLRTLVDSGTIPKHPIVLVNWTNEEGARFEPAMLGSGAYAGVFDRDSVHETADKEGRTLRSALEDIGYRGTLALGAIRFAAMFELHIEQGPILEAESKDIGVVVGVQGMRWYDVVVRGQEAHAGSTPLGYRRDALAAATSMIERVATIAAERKGLSTVGMIQALPGSRNVVPGTVRFSIDLRHHVDDVLDLMEQSILRLVERQRSGGYDVELKRIWDSPPVTFNDRCVAAIRQAAAGLSSMEIVSGAGHDSVHVARVAPTAMIFIPCKDGLSHNEAESATPRHCANGAQVLLSAVMHYDAQ